MNNKAYQSGLTLVELMIAMLIGAFLLGGVIEVFLSSKHTYRMQEGLSRLQENSRFAIGFITDNLRMSGYWGCSSFGTVNVIANPQNLNPNSLPATLIPGVGAAAVSGNDNVSGDWNVNACSADNLCVGDSDAITFSLAGSCGGQLTGNMAADNANIQIIAPNACNIDQYDVVVISDCSSTDIFIATSGAAPPGADKQTIAHANNQNTDNRLSKAYGADAEVMSFNSQSFFLRTNANGQPGLWRLDSATAVGANNPVELVEGIEDMQVLYGVDTDNNGAPDYYVPAADVANMSQVISIRINLLVRSINDNLALEQVPYTFNGITTTPGDRRLRKTLSTTIVIRNRLS